MRKLPWIALALAVVAIAGCTRQSLHEGTSWTTDYDATETPANGGASAATDTTRFYEGRKSVKVAYNRANCTRANCDGQNGIARGIYRFGMRSVPDYEGYFGAAFYLPSDFYSKQTGYVELLRWDNADTLGGSADKGAIAIFADHRARLVRGAADAGQSGVQVVGDPFDIPVGRWADVYVHQRLRGAAPPAPGREGINDVYVNGERVLHAGDVQNSDGNGYDRLLFGLVYNSATQAGTNFEFWFDRAYASSDGPPPPSRPNVLFIVTDDQRSDDTLRTDVMPETLKWFRDGAAGIDGGMQFDNGFVTTPLCCPARSSIFSGRYVHNHRVRGNTEAEGEHLDQEATLQKYLQENGYQTAIYGKYLNGWRIYRDPPHFDKWGTYEQAFGATAANPAGTFRLNEQGVFRNQNEYSVDYVSRKGQEFIDAAESDDDRPWFLYLAVNAPHEPAEPPSRYSAANLPRSQLPDFRPHQNSRNETDVSDKPARYSGWTDARQIFDQVNPATGQTVEGLSTKMLRTLRAVDDMVSGVMGKLKDQGEEKDTLAVFMSDNGYLWREHGVADREVFIDAAHPTQPAGTGVSTKAHPYIESIKVPFFMRWPHNPRIQKDVVDHRFVANIDLAPTVMDAIGVTPPAPMDGVSLLSGARRERLLLEHFGDPDAQNFWASTITDSYHYTEYYGPDGVQPAVDGGQPVREYYDLANDPYEQTNLLQDGNQSNDPDVPTLSGRLQRDRFCVGSECPPGDGAPADHTDPVARITTPPNGAFVTGTVPIVVDATDNVGLDHVTFTADGNTSTDDSYPYEFSWTPTAAGARTISATAYDSAGRSSAPSTITVNVDGFDIQALTGNGDNKISNGDKLRFTFPRPVDPGSLASEWILNPPLTPSDAVTVRVDVHGDASGAPFYNDTITIASTPANAFGTIDLDNWDYAAGLGANPFFGSSHMRMPDARTVEIELDGGSVGAGPRPNPLTTMLWTMGNARDSTGASFCAAPPCVVVESGYPADREFY